jgi:predicted KAP-like P-loop ATPase
MDDAQIAAHQAMPLRDDNPSAVDLFGFEDVVDVVEEIVRRRDLDPVTVGVNAPWGGGKTTVLHLLKKRLATARMCSASSSVRGIRQQD